jgi:putative DNA primase/helicase
MGMAIKAELGDSGFDVWDIWSQQSDSYNAKSAQDVWKSINPNGGVTIATLFYEAKQHGWHDDGTYDTPAQREIAEQQRIPSERITQHKDTSKQFDAAKNAATILEASTPITDHPYLTKSASPHYLMP